MPPTAYHRRVGVLIKPFRNKKCQNAKVNPAPCRNDSPIPEFSLNFDRCIYIPYLQHGNKFFTHFNRKSQCHIPCNGKVLLQEEILSATFLKG